MKHTRQNLLEAADRVVAREGAGSLTLEAVAHEAGVSKGGLLYHFPTKESLITAMVQRLVDEFRELLEAEHTDREPGGFLRAYVRATFAYTTQPLAMAAALAHDPALLQPLADGFAAWKKETHRDGLQAERADIVRLAVDGLWFTELFGFAPLEKRHRKRLENALLELTHP